VFRSLDRSDQDAGSFHRWPTSDIPMRGKSLVADSEITKVFELLRLSEESHRASFLPQRTDDVRPGYTRSTFIQAESTSVSEEPKFSQRERAAQ